MAERGVVVIGAGHNGLACAAYLARAGLGVTVLERRPRVGGACVTEETWPGYRVSRAAYVVGLLRPRLVRELDLERHGLRLLPRSPTSFTPLLDGRSLVLGAGPKADAEEIRRFSARDAEVFPRFEAFVERVAKAVEPMLDAPPPELRLRGPRDARPWWHALRAALRLRRELPRAARLVLGPARGLLREWFDSEPLRGTLATDAVIGAYAAPSSPGTGYVLFHHVMGSVTGKRGIWAYVQGGMGELSEALASAARAAGAAIRTEAPVAHIRLEGSRASGVVLESGAEIAAEAVVSSVDPALTFLRFLDAGALPEDFVRAVRGLDFRSPVVKLNLALRDAPRFRTHDRESAPLTGTIHVGATDLDALERAFDDARNGDVSEVPLAELTIPSIVDPSLAPAGRHVASIFAQYAPARAMDDPDWPALRDRMRDRILESVEALAPGFSDSILELEVLAPPDLESEFGLTGGNIFHGAMTPDRLLFGRPVAGWARYRTPVEALYLCGAGTHPGGGVMGACGRNAACEILHDLPAPRFTRRRAAT
jgi:phytoene dehydrogenase-like protein